MADPLFSPEEYRALGMEPPEPKQAEEASNRLTFRSNLDAVVSDDLFYELPYEDQVQAIREVYLGPELTGNIDWGDDEKEVREDYRTVIDSVRQYNERLVTPEDWTSFTGPAPDISKARNPDEAAAMLDQWEGQGLARFRTTNPLEYLEYGDIAEQQIKEAVDGAKRRLFAEEKYPEPIDPDTTAGKFELAGESTKTFVKGAVGPLVEAVSWLGEQVGALDPGSADHYSRAVQTSKFLTEPPEIFEDPEYLKEKGRQKVGWDVFGLTVPLEDVASGLGSTVGVIAPGLALSPASAGAAMMASMSTAARMGYKQGYDEVFAKTQDRRAAIDAAWINAGVEAADSAFDLLIAKGAIPAVKLGKQAKQKLLTDLTLKGAFGDVIASGMKYPVKLAEQAMDVAGASGASALSEVLQESVQAWGNVLATGDSSFAPKAEELVTAAIVGGLGGAGLHMGGQVAADLRGSISFDAVSGPEAKPAPAKVADKGTELKASSTEPATETPLETIIETPPEPKAEPEDAPAIVRAERGEIESGTDTTLTGKEYKFKRELVDPKSLVMQRDIPNVKKDADPETGLVGDPKKFGKFSAASAGNVMVLEKDVTRNGEREVISGRNRTAAAQLQNVPKIGAIVVKESEGFTTEDAKLLDAEMNIRDNRGETEDYVEVFQKNKVPLETAIERGLLRNEKDIGARTTDPGMRGYIIGTYGSPDLISAFKAEKISEREAAVIAYSAPNDPGLQRLGMQQAQKKAPPAVIANVMEIAKRSNRGTGQQGSLFGADEFTDVETLANVAAELRKDAEAQLAALNAGKRVAGLVIPGMTGKLNMEDPKAVERARNALKDRIRDLSPTHWPSIPALVSEIEGIASERLAAEGRQIGFKLTQPPTAQVAAEPVTVPSGQGTLFNYEANSDFSRAVRNPPPVSNVPQTSTVGVPGPAQQQTEIFDDGQDSRTPLERGEYGIDAPINRFTLPALVKLARETVDSLRLFKGDTGLRGMFAKRGRGTSILINQKLPKDPDLLNNVLAHEIGHAIDLAAETPGIGSNPLGKLAPLAKHRKNMMGDTEVATKLLPSADIKSFDGTDYRIVVSFGRIYPFVKTPKGQYRMTSLGKIPSDVLNQYERQISNNQSRELFAKVRNWKKSDGPRPITETYTIDKASGLVLADPIMQAQMFQLSATWRPIPSVVSDDFLDYRSDAKELYADLVSAMLNNAQWVKDNFPDLFQAFRSSVAGKPKVQQVLSDLNDLLANPAGFSDLLATESAVAAEKFKEKVKEEIGKKQQRENWLTKLKREGWEGIRNIPFRYMESFIPLEEALQHQLNKLISQRDTLKDRLKRIVSRGARSEYAKMKQREMKASEAVLQIGDTVEGFRSVPQREFLYLTKVNKDVEVPLRGMNVSFKDWHNYLKAYRIINETSQAREDILNNPDSARFVFRWLSEAASRVGYNFTPATTSYLAELGTSPDYDAETLADEAARLDVLLSESDPDGKKRAALIELANEDEAPEVAGLINEGAFNIRRYLANPDGWDVAESERQIDRIANKYGPDVFRRIEEIRHRFGDINWDYAIQPAIDAGLLSPELAARAALNKYNYVNFSVNHHFFENPVLDPTFRKQFGTFSEIGDTFFSTAGKSALILGRAARQKAVNVMLDLLKDQLGSERMRQVAGKGMHLPKIMYEKLDALRYEQLKNPTGPEAKKSYLVEMRDGKPTLWEVDDPRYQEMFYRKSIHQYGPEFRFASVMNAFQKGIYTVQSPRFVYISDPIRNVRREADFSARGWLRPTIFWSHISPKMRARSAAAEEMATELYEWAQGERDTVSENLPYFAEVMDMVEKGRLVLPLGKPSVLPLFMQSPEDMDLTPSTPLSEMESVTELVKAFGLPGDRSGLFEAGRDAILGAVSKVPGGQNLMDITAGLLDRMARKAQIEEMRTKITGYQLLREDRGYSHEEAIRGAELLFGAPRPRGGGAANPLLESMFLFWRVGAYTPRILRHIGYTDPGIGSNIAARKMIQMSWRVPAYSAAVAAGLMSLFDWDDDDDKQQNQQRLKRLFDIAAQKISRYEKSAQNPTPYGFWDPDQGMSSFKFLWDADPDIVSGSNWKVLYIRRASDPDERLIGKLLFSAMENFSDSMTGKTNPKDLFQQSMTDVGSELPEFDPLVKSVTDIFKVVRGENPTDDFHQQGLLPKEISQGGSTLDRLKFMTQYVLSRHLPLVPTPQASKEELEGMEKFLKQFPGVSAFIGSTNYGEIELSKNLETIERNIRTQRRREYPDNVRNMKNEYDRLKREGETKRIANGTQQRYLQLGDWHYSVFEYFDNEIGESLDMGDTKRASELEAQLGIESNRQAGAWRAARGRNKARRKQVKQSAKVSQAAVAP